MGRMYSKSNKVKGVFFILGAAFFFALMSLFVRLSGDLPTFEKMFFRNIVALLVSFFIVVKNRQSFYVEKESRLFLFLRLVVGTLGILFHYYSIDHMNIADANVLNKLGPFFAMIASYFLMGERTTKLDWIVTFIAFIGAGFVAKPSWSTEAFWGLIAVAGGLATGLAYTFVRRLSKNGFAGELIIFYFSLFSTLVSLLFMLGGFKPIQPRQLMMLIAAGLSATGGQFCVTKAYTYAPAKDISTFDYTQVIYSAILGVIFLGQIPDIYSIIGYILIIGMAVLRWKYNQKGV